jgi:hypothetical protein
VLKIDVEGAEVGVLQGMRAMLSTVKPVLIIELHGTGAAVAEILGDVGYEQSPIGATGDADGAPPSHIVARPAEDSEVPEVQAEAR